MLLALVIWPLATRPFGAGGPFLFLIETPPTFGCSLRFSHILHRNCLLILSPSCFAVCGHHLSPRTAIVFSLLSSLPNSSMSHLSNFLISTNSRGTIYTRKYYFDTNGQRVWTKKARRGESKRDFTTPIYFTGHKAKEHFWRWLFQPPTACPPTHTNERQLQIS